MYYFLLLKWKVVFKVFPVVFLLLFYCMAVAQKPGKLTGKIQDVANNEPLSGVSISVKNSKLGTTTIMDGTYVLSLPPGTYTIRYSATSYKTKEITDVIVKENEETFQNILMEAATKQMGEVVITGGAKKESTAAVYSLQKRSAAASDGISIETINRTPDNNSSQVLRRVTGVNVSDNKFVVIRGLSEQYNQTMLNGVPMTSTENNKNAFAFDLIPAAAIDNIVVNKTATPDMPGSFAGGIVQINTKDFPAKTFFSVSVQGGASDYTYGKDFYSDERASLQFMGFDGGIRNLPKDFPANSSRVPFTFLNRLEQIRYYSMLPNNLLPVNQGPSGLNEQVQIGFGKNFNFKNKNQLGIVASLNQRKTNLIEEDVNARNPQIGKHFFTDAALKNLFISQNINPGSLPDVVGSYSENIRYRYNVDLGGVLNLAYRFGTNKITLKNLITQVYSNQFVNRPYVFNTGLLEQTPGYQHQAIGYNYINTTKRIINFTLGGEHRTGSGNETRIDWNVTTTFNQQNSPDKRNFLFGVDSLTGRMGINTNIIDLSRSIATASRIWEKLNDFILTSGFNLTTPFTIQSKKQLFKTGVLIQNRYRRNRVSVIAFGSLTGTPETILSADNLINGNATISSNAEIASEGGDYNAGSSLVAVYESIENKIGEKLRIIWGTRLEKYQQNANIYTPVYYDGFVSYEPVVKYLSSRVDFNLLPSVNIIYSPYQPVNIRGAVSRTAIRPDLKDIIDFPSFDVANLRVIQGNPELRSTRVTNYDLKFEWFPSAGELISVSAFYKDIIDPIEYITPTDIAIPLSGIPVNTGKAFVRGMELEVRKKLDFIKLIPWLKHVSLFGNSTILESKVFAKELPSVIVNKILEHRLTGQPNLIINAGVSISAFKNTMECTFTFNRYSDYIGELGSFDPMNGYNIGGVTLPPETNNYFRPQRIPNYYVRRRNVLDFVMSKSFYKNKAKVKLNIGNIFREPFILYQDLNDNNKFDEPLRIQGGPGFSPFSPSPGRYKSGVDNTASMLTGQRLYEFTFTYTF